MVPRGPQAETKAVDMELSDLASEDAICSFRGGTRDVPLLDSEKLSRVRVRHST